VALFHYFNGLVGRLVELDDLEINLLLAELLHQVLEDEAVWRAIWEVVTT
jgi:hypothetical protein